MVSRGQQGAIRIGAGATLAVVVSLGLYLSDKMGRDSRDRIAGLEQHAVSVEEVNAKVDARAAVRQNDPAAFAVHVDEDAKKFGVETSMLQLGAAQAFSRELDEAAVLSRGRSLTTRHFKATAVVDKVQFQQQGAMLASKHSILSLTNTSKTPVAYFVQVRSHDQGTCDARGARMHNAMALMPGESADIVVCAGAGKIRIDELLALEITPLGYYYVSQVPPEAVGYDGVTQNAHRPLRRLSPCTDLGPGTNPKRLGERVQQGLLRWVDVADFYSRHDCHRFPFVMGHRHTGEPLARLPVVQ